MKSLISPQELAQADRILFVTHLALGDFTYLQNFFSALSRTYPHLKIDLWVDEVRRTHKFWKWKQLKAYSLYDWVRQAGIFSKVYDQTYSPRLFAASVKDAQQQNYDYVISLCIVRPHFYARLARKIATKGKAFALVGQTKLWNVIKRYNYSMLDGSVVIKRPEKGSHITQTYAAWFREFFGLEVSQADRAAYITIPRQWDVWARMRFMKLEIDKTSHKFSKVVFINPFAKTIKRSWPIERVYELVSSIKRLDKWNDVSFIINVVPEELKRIEAFFNKHPMKGVHLFSATHSFFQLPAILNLCDIVVTVETSIMHFAAALDIPQIALMRQKNPEWAPLKGDLATIITTHNRNAWIKDIPVKHVMDELAKKFHDGAQTDTYQSLDLGQ